MLPQKLIQVVKAVQEAKKRIDIAVPKAITFFSQHDEWVFTAVYDNKVCHDCLQHEHHIYNGDMLRALFPDLEIQGLEKILPKVHPNCRCRLDRVQFWGDVEKE